MAGSASEISRVGSVEPVMNMNRPLLRATLGVWACLLGGCPAPMETQIRTIAPSTSGTPRAEEAAAALPAIAGSEGYVLLPQRVDVKEDAEAVDCIARSISQAAPKARRVPFEQVRDGLFPWLEPGTKPAMPEDLLELMKRPLLSDRLKTFDVRYVVHVGGREMHQTPNNHFGCALNAGCFDFTSQKRASQLGATLLDLRDGVALGGRDATARGTATTVVIGIIPIMFLAPTGSQVCTEVGTAIAKAFAAGEAR